MPIPTVENFLLPLLRGLADGEVHPIREFRDKLCDEFGLSEAEREELLPSGQRMVANRIGWARTYLNKAGLIESPKRGYWIVSEEGKRVLERNLPAIDNNFLKQYESFREFLTPKTKEESDTSDGQRDDDSSATPDEVIDAAYLRHRKAVQSDLLETLKKTSPFFFEKVVLQLLRGMGYGGVTGRGLVTPKSSDGGIDGVIYEDKLGLDTVVIQAKRWEGTVGRQTVQAFVGSMDLHRSRKGVVLTTSKYSHDAIDYIERIEGKKVVLIDGDQLTELMIDYQIGVTPTKNYQLVDVSQDFFDEDS
jgi:restriction system protein